jgi:ABC-type sugar transport system permease subunit
MKQRELRTCLVFISPAIIFFVVFWALPVLMAGYYSFTDWQVGRSAPWVGVANFTELFGDPLFRTAIKASLTIAVLAVIGGVGIALSLALILAHPDIRAARWWRLAIFIPVVTDWVSTGLVWQMMFLRDRGVIAQILAKLGFTSLVRTEWTTDPTLAPIAIAIFIVWKTTGLYTLFFLAALKAVPTDVLEASTVDGASAWQRFRYVRWPLMKPITVFIIVIAFVTALGLYEPIFMLTGGGPAGKTRALPIFLLENFFQFERSGYASAAGLIFLGMSLTFAFVASRVMKEAVS